MLGRKIVNHLNREICSFDMDDFVKIDNDNKVQSLKHLRKDGYWKHFEAITGYYHGLLQDLPCQNLAQEIFSHYLSNCSINFIKGITNVIGGHHTDSSIFIRKTIESVRYTAFIRDTPNVVQFWGKPEGKAEFNKSYKHWFPEGVGRSTVEKEFPMSEDHYKRATTYGPHSNYALFSVQHVPSNVGVRILYTEIENSLEGYLNLLSMYFWHLRVHISALKWWVTKSGLSHHLSKEEIARLDEDYKAIEEDYEKVLNRVSLHRYGVPKSELKLG